MKRLILFFLLLPYLCKAQSQDSTVIMRFNKHSSDFAILKFGSSLPSSIKPDSIKHERRYVSEDKFERNFTEYRFKGICLELKASYYVLCIDSIVHLISISISEVDSSKADQLIRKFSKKLEPLEKTNHGSPKESYFNFQKKFCTPLNWLHYNPAEKNIRLQLSDWFYCTRIEF